MLTLKVEGEEYWNEDTEMFEYPEATSIRLEHSLVSLSKWESKYHKVFLSATGLSPEEKFGYLEAMLLDPEDAPYLSRLSKENVEEIDAYINNPMTGTTIVNVPKGPSRSTEKTSAELIYFWMSQYQIDISCEHWHLNRLIMLIRVHHAKSQKPEKMSASANSRRMAELNAQRLAKYNTTG